MKARNIEKRSVAICYRSFFIYLWLTYSDFKLTQIALSFNLLKITQLLGGDMDDNSYSENKKWNECIKSCA